MTETVRPETAIAEHEIIGDLRTAALVTTDGSIDWLCCPHFDSPSVFGALLDDEKGGRFQIYPTDEMTKSTQLYLPDTNILITRFFTTTGAAEITDFMPIDEGGERTWQHRLVRRVTVVHGTVNFKMICQPAFNYARTPHHVELQEHGAIFRTNDLTLGLATGQPLTVKD